MQHSYSTSIQTSFSLYQALSASSSSLMHIKHKALFIDVFGLEIQQTSTVFGSTAQIQLILLGQCAGASMIRTGHFHTWEEKLEYVTTVAHTYKPFSCLTLKNLGDIIPLVS